MGQHKKEMIIMGMSLPRKEKSDSQGAPPLLNLIQLLFQEVRTFIDQNIELGKTEIKEETTQWGQAAALFSGGALLAQIGIGFFALTIMILLTVLIPLWTATLLMSLLFVLLGALLFQRGRHLIKEKHPQ